MDVTDHARPERAREHAESFDDGEVVVTQIGSARWNATRRRWEPVTTVAAAIAEANRRSEQAEA